MSLESRLSELRRKHSELSEAAEREQRSPGSDDQVIAAMKKRKLQLKEEIARIEDEMASEEG
jgi:hypothetical protein